MWIYCDFYPSNPTQVEMITSAAMKNGFTGGIIIDYPNSKKAKKYYLFLCAGFSEEIYNEAKSVIMPEAKTGDESEEEFSSDGEGDITKGGNSKGYKKKDEQIGMYGKSKKNVMNFTKSIQKKKYHSEHGQFKSKSWILAKKDRAKKQGKQTVSDSKYSGRKRPAKF